MELLAARHPGDQDPLVNDEPELDGLGSLQQGPVAADDIVDQYDCRLLGKGEHDGITVYRIESTSHEEAAVVWGKEVLEIRADFVLLSNACYDQDGLLVKRLTTLEVGEMGGRMLALHQSMAKEESPDAWT